MEQYKDESTKYKDQRILNTIVKIYPLLEGHAGLI